MTIFRKIKIKWQIWRGKAIDIWSKSAFPADALSNLCSNGFRFDGMVCGSMEGFLQSLKQREPDKQRQVCSMKGRKARKMTTTRWQTDQIVWWKGKAIDRQGSDFTALVRQAYRAMFEQNERFRTALMATRGMHLYHTRGESNRFKTILTEQEFCGILTDLREAYDQRDKTQELIDKSVPGAYPLEECKRSEQVINEQSKSNYEKAENQDYPGGQTGPSRLSSRP